MGGVSRARAEAHRAEVVEAAARLARERGMSQVSVPEVMGAAGLTHGGFYRHFASKEGLFAAACAAAFGEQGALLDDLLADESFDPRAAHTAFVTWYLSAEHRDDPGHGCAAAALGPDVSRTELDSPVRESFRAGVRGSAERLARLGERPTGKVARERDALVEFATLVGALSIARAARGGELSDEILAAARDRLLR
jgi:TetR/AcrR family transcriptional repressor of nem operon